MTPLWTPRRLGLLAAFGAAVIFLPGWWRWYQLQHRTGQLDGEIAALTIENQRLLGEMDRLQQDPVYLERVARRKLGRTRKGEVVYKIASPSDSTAAPPTP